MKRLLISLFVVLGIGLGQDKITLVAPPPNGVNGVSTTIVGNQGNNQYYYWIVSNWPVGKSQAIGTYVINAPTLSASNYVRINFVPNGAINYDILITTTPIVPASCTACAVTLGNTTGTFNDTGGVRGAYTYNPAPNASATITLDNKSFTQPRIVNNVPWNSTLFANLPSASSATGLTYLVIDAASTSNCILGGGLSTPALCWSNGLNWIAIGGGGGGSGVVPISVAGNPNSLATACTATVGLPIGLAVDSTTGNVWACTTVNAFWYLLPTTIGSGPATISAVSGTVSTGLAAARPACTVDALYYATDTHVLSQCSAVTTQWSTLNGAGSIAVVYDTTAGTLQTYDSGGNKFTAVKGITNPGDSNCVLYIDTGGVQQRGACGGGTGGNTTLFHLGPQTETSLTTNTDNVVGTYTLPSLAAGQCVMLQTYFKHSTGAASITYRWWFGATNNGASASTAGTAVYRDNWYFCNNAGVQNAQTAYLDAADGTALGTNSFQTFTPAENTTAPVVIKFTANPGATAANGVTLYGFTVLQ